MSRTLAYAVGVAGVVAGGVVYQQGDVPMAIAIWIVTFAVGALMMIAAFLLQAMTTVLARLAILDRNVHVLLGRQGPGADPPVDPPARW